jgi:predicted CXXCH cytochrome family protein
MRSTASVLLALGLAAMAIAGATATTVLQPPTEIGNAACRSCHRQIYDAYARTQMARTSGPALAGLVEGNFTHAPSGIRYRVFAVGDRAALSFERPGDAAVRGRVPLKYFVGSNTRGRTFLFEIDRFLYQSPINYYARTGTWDMSPGYADLTAMPLNHAVDQTCLSCHASQLAAVEPGTTNRFEGEAFGQDGVGCERCHGPGSDHAAGRGGMINPAHLAPEARDSICTQCHLEGQSRIARAGRTLTDFRPGQRLSDSIVVFVFANAASAARGAVSHVESLAESVCKRKSGDRMSCLSCHDPHAGPEPAARVEYYRGKCVQCHAALAADHHQDQRDCVACHMPRVESADIGHTAVTDHRILRDPRASGGGRLGEKLVPFGGASAEDRDLGLAYAEIALRGNESATHEAKRLLEGIIPRYRSDQEVLTRLAYLEQAENRLDRAEALYQRSLGVDPSQPVAATNLGVILANRGMMSRALTVWRPAFDRHPEASELGVDIALATCKAGDWKGAEDELRIVLEHNPDFDSARQVAARLAQGPNACRGD